MADAMNRRTYTMSLLAMVFLPTTFLTGLFGVNLGGIPGNSAPFGFVTFCLMLLASGRRRPVAEAQPLAVGKMTKTRLTLSNINI